MTKRKNTSSKRFDPELSLFSLPVVRLIAVLGIGISLFLAYQLKTHVPFEFNWTKTAYSETVDYFKIPLGILAVTLTLIGICGANHKSEQTRRQIERTMNQINLTTSQIELTKSQNEFSNYYKHIEEFEKYCKSHSSKRININFPRRLHRNIFPEARKGNYHASDVFIEEMRSVFNFCLNEFEAFGGTNPEKRFASGYIILQKLKNFSDHVGIVIENGGGGVNIQSIHGPYVLKFGKWSEFVLDFFEIFTTLDQVLQFDLDFKQSELVRFLPKIDVSFLIPSDNMHAPFNLRNLIIPQENFAGNQ